jgi:hypothetical protein
MIQFLWSVELLTFLMITGGEINCWSLPVEAAKKHEEAPLPMLQRILPYG